MYYIFHKTKGSYSMIDQLDPNLLTKQNLSYHEDTIEEVEESFMHYIIDTSSEAEYYCRDEDQEIRMMRNILESCLVESTDASEKFADLQFFKCDLNNVQIKDLYCWYLNFRKCNGKTVTITDCVIETINIDGTIENNSSDIIEDHIPFYTIDSLTLQGDCEIEKIRVSTSIINHLIIDTNNDDDRLVLFIKNYGISNTAKINKITIKKNVKLRIQDYTKTFKNTLIIKEGEGERSNIIIEDV